MRRALLASSVLLALAAAHVEPASACSCFGGDPRRMLAGADAAIVGVLVDKRLKDPPLRTSADISIYTFRIVEVVKGRLGETVEVESSTDGGSCGINASPGRPVGLLLYRNGGRWQSGLCMQLSPAELRRAAAPLPRPNGSGPVALVAGGSFGPARLVALDRRGRTLRYAYGDGETRALALCPGRRLVELVGDARFRLVVRELPTLRRLRELVLTRDPRTYAPDEVSCAGGDVFVAASGEVRSRILRVRGRRVSTIRLGPARIRLHGASAYVAHGSRLVRLNLVTGRRQELGRLPSDLPEVLPSPDGRHLAGVSAARAAVMVVDVRTRRVRTLRLGDEDSGIVAWVDARRLLFSSYVTRRASIFDTRLRRVGVLAPWQVTRVAAGGNTVYGIAFDGRVVAARLPRAPVRALGRLPGPSVSAFLAVPPS